MPLPLADRMEQLLGTSTDTDMRPPDSGTRVGDSDDVTMDDNRCSDSYSEYSYSDTEYSYYSESEESESGLPPIPNELPSIAADVMKAMETVRKHTAIDPAKQFKGADEEFSDGSEECEAPRRVPTESVVQTPPTNKRAARDTPVKKKRKVTAYHNFIGHTMRDPMFEPNALHTVRLGAAARSWSSLSPVDKLRWTVSQDDDAAPGSTTATAIPTSTSPPTPVLIPVPPPAASSIAAGCSKCRFSVRGCKRCKVVRD